MRESGREMDWRLLQEENAAFPIEVTVAGTENEVRPEGTRIGEEWSSWWRAPQSPTEK